MGKMRETLQLSSPSIYSFLVQQFYSYANGNMTSLTHVQTVHGSLGWLVGSWLNTAASTCFQHAVQGQWWCLDVMDLSSKH